MFALPCLHFMLREIINVLMQCDSIPDVPLVHGFIYEQRIPRIIMVGRDSTKVLGIH